MEIGPGNGFMSKELKKIFPYALETTNDLINFKSPLNYEFIVCTNVLEHIDNLNEFLEKIKKHCCKTTIILFSIPNAESLNRMFNENLKGCHDLHKGDLAVGHKQMFTYLELYDLLISNGFIIQEMFTKIYKPFNNDIMIKLPKEVIEYCINKNTGMYGAEIFVIGKVI